MFYWLLCLRCVANVQDLLRPLLCYLWKHTGHRVFNCFLCLTCVANVQDLVFHVRAGLGSAKKVC